MGEVGSRQQAVGRSGKDHPQITQRGQAATEVGARFIAPCLHDRGRNELRPYAGLSDG